MQVNTPESGFKDEAFEMAVDPQGMVWTVDKQHLYRYQNGSWEKIALPVICSLSMYELALDPTGGLWLYDANSSYGCANGERLLHYQAGEIQPLAHG